MVHVDAEPELGAGGGAMGYGVRFGASLDDGTRVSAEALRRLTCDAALVPVTADTEAGKVLDVGRRTRTIPTALRRALWVRDGGCRFPGCGSRRFLHGHHVRHWMNGGATSLENLVLLCGFHHRLVHEEGFRADAEEIGGAIELSFRTPFGRLLEATAPQAPASDDPIEWFELDERDRHIEIDAATNLPLWDGHPVRYDEVVDALFSPS
jgi:hypothetical protein